MLTTIYCALTYLFLLFSIQRLWSDESTEQLMELSYTYEYIVQVLRVGPLDDESYFVLRDLQMTSKSE